MKRDDEDLEPNLSAGGKAPVKKAMADFLAEFERRLAVDPDRPATGALREVAERAAGVRRLAAGATADDHPAGAPEASGAIPAGDGYAPSPPNLQAPSDAPGVAAASSSTDTAGETEAVPAVAGESRRLRRRRRKHRHRSH